MLVVPEQRVQLFWCSVMHLGGATITGNCRDSVQLRTAREFAPVLGN